MENLKKVKRNQKELKKLKPFKISPCYMKNLKGGNAKGGFAVGGADGCTLVDCPWWGNCPLMH